MGRESLPVAVNPAEDELATRNISSCEPPLSGTKTTEPSEVIPPDAGAVPVDTVAGLSAVSIPVAGEYANCEISFDCVSTTYTKSSMGSMMNELAPIPFAGTGDPLTVCSVPLAVGQAGVTSMQAE